jgi:hypothetical protein
MSVTTPTKDALRDFKENLREAPRRILETAFRSGKPTTDRTRSTFVFGNVFLHLHSARTHRWSLRWTATMGLGVASAAAFFITLVTGILLMFYYKPYPDAAYDSIKDIHFVVPTGRFIRNIHLGGQRDSGHRDPAHGARFLHGLIPAPPRIQLAGRNGAAGDHARAVVHRLLASVGSARLLGDHHRGEHRAVAARGHRRAADY